MEITIFENAEFGSIRTAEINNDIWFVGKDVAEALGYSNTSDAILKHVDEEDKGVAKCDTLGGVQNLTVINESGVYALVFGSKLPTAKAFKRWVTSEVLPSIRKKGGYIHTTEEDTPDVIMAKALILAQQTIEEKKKIIASQQRVLEENRPKVAFAEAVEASSDCMNVHTLAKIICQKGGDIGEKRLYAWLREIGLIIQGRTIPTQRATNMELFRIEMKPNTKNGQYYPVTMVTPKGQRYILGKYFEY